MASVLDGFDQDAYWGLGIGAAIMGRTPFIGSNLVHCFVKSFDHAFEKSVDRLSGTRIFMR